MLALSFLSVYGRIAAMTTPVQDPTFQAGASVYGYAIPGLGVFGAARTYPQKAVYGQARFGNDVVGLDQEEAMLPFIQGAPIPREKGPWPVSPFMNDRARGAWAKRAIFQTVGGLQKVRRYTPWDGSPKAHLTPFQPKLREAVALWHLLDIGTKRILNAEASRLGLRCSGYNYFIKLYLLDDPEWETFF